VGLSRCVFNHVRIPEGSGVIGMGMGDKRGKAEFIGGGIEYGECSGLVRFKARNPCRIQQTGSKIETIVNGDF